MPPRARPTEDALIARYFAPLAGAGGLDLKDDVALVRPAPRRDLVLTTDAVVAGIHFLADDPPASIGRKALNVNLSDLAAKGAEPVAFLLALALPDGWTTAWLKRFAAGLGEAAAASRCPLVGGDTVRAGGPLTISITALGQVPAKRMVRRATARPGDRLCVTGTIGDAALGLALQRGPAAPWVSRLSARQRAYLVDRYRHPVPRLAIAAALRRYASAAMDVSDGLAGDLAKMMRAGATSARVDLDRVPVSAAACVVLDSDRTMIDQLVTGGDDYEILCAVPEHRLVRFREETAAAGVPVSVIGAVTNGHGLPIFRSGAGERRYRRGSFSHF